MNIEEAEDIARRALAEIVEPGKHVFLRENAKEVDIGWLVFAERRSFVETGDPNMQAPGLNWIFVDKDTRKVEFISSAMSPEAAVEDTIGCRFGSSAALHDNSTRTPAFGQKQTLAA